MNFDDEERGIAQPGDSAIYSEVLAARSGSG